MNASLAELFLWAGDYFNPIRSLRSSTHRTWNPRAIGSMTRLIKLRCSPMVMMGMATLLDELLNFSRLGRVEMQSHDVKLADLVARVREELDAEPDAQRVKWEIGKLPEVEGDLSLLHQCWSICSPTR
jgi:light-regulated signal transduction histidine kinase (bacteriophytochrome)